MRSTAVLTFALSLVASALAYSVSEPNASQGWTTAGPNTLAWSMVSTDAVNFTAVLTNQDTSIMPQNNQVLNALVVGSLNSITVNAPSGGWPVGGGFRVNLVKDTDDLTTIFAQSVEFNITQATTTLSRTSTSAAASSPANTASASLTSGAASTTDTNLLNPTTSATASGASALSMNAGLMSVMGFVGALLL